MKQNYTSFGHGVVNLRTDEKTRTISGYAIVFNQRSKLLVDFDRWQMVEEVIRPEAVTDTLLKSCDIVACIEHDPDRMLARWHYGKGTLSLRIDSYGLWFSFQVPKTKDGDYAWEMIRRGDMFGCSFAYSTDAKKNVSYSEEVKKDGSKVLIRYVNKIDAIYDVSVVRNPAYMGTTVEARKQREELCQQLLRSVNDNGMMKPTNPRCLQDSRYLRSLYDGGRKVTQSDHEALQRTIRECDISLSL